MSVRTEPKTYVFYAPTMRLSHRNVADKMPRISITHIAGKTTSSEQWSKIIFLLACCLTLKSLHIEQVSVKVMSNTYGISCVSLQQLEVRVLDTRHDKHNWRKNTPLMHPTSTVKQTNRTSHGKTSTPAIIELLEGG